MGAYSTQELTWSDYEVELMLQQLCTQSGAPLSTGATLHLLKGTGLSMTPSTALADLTAGECDFTGYDTAGVALAPIGPVNLGPDRRACIDTITYVATDPEGEDAFVANDVTGYYIQDAGRFVAGELFAPGQEMLMSAPGDFVEINVSLPISLYQSAV